MAAYHRRFLGAVVLAVGCVATAGAQQQHKYLVEVGAAGAITTFDDATELDGAAGGLVRVGLWLPLNFSVEGEAAFASPKAKAAAVGVNVRTLSGSVLYNMPVGTAHSAYLRAGVGSTSYGSPDDCANAPPGTICGRPASLIGGLGFRWALSPILMVRGEATYNRNRATPATQTESVSFANYSATLGLSVMLGSRPIRDSDRDGVLDDRDRCSGTGPDAQIDGQGCPIDSDNDRVANGVDRCPGTPAGATVDIAGCPIDSDNDNIIDGIDRCPNTATGVLVDSRGCPRDTDEDGIADGLDRCSATPKGATVDAVGCPFDEDSDGVLDGLDQCPRSPPGTVNAAGCGAGQTRDRPVTPQPVPVPVPVPVPQPMPTPAPQPKPAPGPSSVISTTPRVIEGVSFYAGTARLYRTSYVALDSIAAILLADTTLHVEIGAHVENAGPAEESRRLTMLQAEAVHTYLAQKGVAAQQITARGYGASVPLTPDTTPRGRLRNRRIEIRRVPAGP